MTGSLWLPQVPTSEVRFHSRQLTADSRQLTADGPKWPNLCVFKETATHGRKRSRQLTAGDLNHFLFGLRRKNLGDRIWRQNLGGRIESKIIKKLPGVRYRQAQVRFSHGQTF